MSSPANPAVGLERIDGASGSVLWVDPRYAPDVAALGLLEAGGLDRVVAGAEPGAQGRGATGIITLPRHGERLHLRPLSRGGWLAPLLGTRLLRITRPLHEVTQTRILRERGAPVPQAIVVLGVRKGSFWRGAVGTLHEEGSVDATTFLGRDVGTNERVRAARSAGQAIRRFHDLGGRHPDLHAGNLLLRPSGEGFEVVLIDLDRVRVGTRVSARRRAAELTRLLRSLHKHGLFERVGVRGCAALLGGYAGSDRRLRASLVRHLRRQQIGLGLHRIGYRIFPIEMR